MILRRILEIVGLMMVGEAVVMLIRPRRHMQLWHIGPEPVRQLASDLAHHPEATRTIAVLELAFGLWLSLRATE